MYVCVCVCVCRESGGKNKTGRLFVSPGVLSDASSGILSVTAQVIRLRVLHFTCSAEP